MTTQEALMPYHDGQPDLQEAWSRGYEAALREAPSALGLDVERLARTLDNLWEARWGPLPMPKGQTTINLENAAAIAREYAALAPSPDTEEKDRPRMADHKGGSSCAALDPHEHVGTAIRWLTLSVPPQAETVIRAAVEVAMQRGGDAALRANGLAITSRKAMDRLVLALIAAGRTTRVDSDPAEAEGMEDWTAPSPDTEEEGMKLTCPQCGRPRPCRVHEWWPEVSR